MKTWNALAVFDYDTLRSLRGHSNPESIDSSLASHSDMVYLKDCIRWRYRVTGIDMLESGEGQGGAIGLGLGVGLGLGLGLGICHCLTALTMTSMERDRGKCTGRRSSSIKPSVLYVLLCRNLPRWAAKAPPIRMCFKVSMSP